MAPKGPGAKPQRKAERRDTRREPATPYKERGGHGSGPIKPFVHDKWHNQKRGLRGGASRLPAALYAQFIFRGRCEDWKSFNVPVWFAEQLGCKPWYFRVPAGSLKYYQRELTLLARMSWMLYSSQNPKPRPGLSQYFTKYTARVPSERTRRCALRTVSRHLNQSNLMVRPKLMATHYWPRENAVLPITKMRTKPPKRPVKSSFYDLPDWILPFEQLK